MQHLDFKNPIIPISLRALGSHILVLSHASLVLLPPIKPPACILIDFGEEQREKEKKVIKSEKGALHIYKHRMTLSDCPVCTFNTIVLQSQSPTP